jgi:hypothetical membrane protein
LTRGWRAWGWLLSGWLLSGWLVRSGRSVPGWAIVSAGLAPLVLTAGWIIAGLFQPSSYSPVRQTVSLMAGHQATDPWIITTTLILLGCCYLVTAAGLTGIRPAARVLLVIAGLSSLGIAASPESAGGPTAVHLAWTVIGAIIIAIWPAAAGWGSDGQFVVLSVPVRVVVTATFLALLGWLLSETQGGTDLGLAERLDTSVQTVWPFVVALALRLSGSEQLGAAPAKAAARR